MAGKVRSGDPDNLEAQAARIYWQALFGEDASGETFRRDPEGEGINLYLNYGYAVLRAIVARALCAAGLHPSLGVHHHNRYDTFCLADDLMEPFRPLVDRVVAQLRREAAAVPPAVIPSPIRSGQAPAGIHPVAPDGVIPARAGIQLDQSSKKAILAGLLVRYTAEGESRTLFDWASRSASSLAALIEDREEQLRLPLLVPTEEEADDTA
jgi:CRISPR-associated protein Cas1